ncbi:class I SAM-dependent rRNA methyltransferase [Dyella sp. LX-66]|uniref:class I SAM-dependent rRNA methyltransferase n=1 Tax=unclassified Dyella TaxID=2634549 RepID=UPI001BE11935|nr:MULTISPECIES: class I SAM-dependent rRNA methyltransferase [unclassified Dyella]MBT2116372.1 class I SAM-dependent rRNA methyltransferase [Dyella sp. LX-1]MBT2140685.1 class I SAM-dependent rRNA methyltransferase [Dyella sp. LX-66]
MNSLASPALPVIRLKSDRMPGHPWVWSAQVHKPAERLPPGSVVEVVDAKDRFVGRAFWNGHARIALRLLTADADQAIDASWIAARIARAVQLRRDWLALDQATDAWRVVHSEGDGLSGLIVDRYADILVIEYFAAGMWKFREAIHAALLQHFPGARLYWFTESHVQKQESFDCRAAEAPAPVEVHEHGLRFHAAPGLGHKTGFFADQRDNRARFAELARGRRVLDLCCNAGGFAVHALAGGASEATGVDMDAGILDVARANAAANGVDAKFEQADIFDWLRAAVARGEQYDAVVLDPAKLTRDRNRVVDALKKYFAMNRLALDVIPPGGLLLTCSCTGLVSEADFLEMLRRVALNAGREIQVLEARGAGPDHPVRSDVPEGRYLKAVFCRVW